MTSRRRSIWLPWVVAAAILTGLAIAVVSYLSGSGEHVHVHNALTRAGDVPHETLLSTQIVRAWHLDALALGLVTVMGALYATGIALRAANEPAAPWPVRRTVGFTSGLIVIALATNSSIAVYDQVLFSAHMIGHLALVMVAPALLVSGAPLRLALEASTPPTVARIEAVLNSRLVSLVLSAPVALASYAVVIVGTHLSAIINVIMQGTWAGQLEHLVYLLVGYQFFVLVVGDEPVPKRMGVPARWVLLAIAMVVDTFTGLVLLMTGKAVQMAPAPFYVNALTDTRTGGAIMWVFGDSLMVLMMILISIGWVTRDSMGRAPSGWMEQARQSVFTTRTGAAETVLIDDSDEGLAAYNAWLASMAEREKR